MKEAVATWVAVPLLVAGVARAEPSLWDAARSPLAKRASESFVAAERMRERAQSGFVDPFSQRDFTLAATALLELAGGEHLRDPRLHYLLGDLLLDPLLAVNRAREARQLLQQALAEAPESPLAARGLFNLAIASAKLSKQKDEFRAYSRALELEFDSDVRATIFANRADSRMVAGDVKAAIADYRRAVRLAQLPHSQALSQWGLGVALERDGDLPSALTAIAIASSIRLPSPPYAAPDVLDLPEVFFVPAYDVHYYRALAAMGRARRVTPAEERGAALTLAVSEWARYIERGLPDAAPWLAHAESHKARCELALKSLARERASSPPRQKPAAARARR